MSNMIIGNVRLTIDPNSLAIIDTKNNAVLSSSRDSGPVVLPVGNSDIAIQMGIVFPNVDDVNSKLRQIIAIKRGLPFVNVKSDVIASAILNNVGNLKIASKYLEDINKKKKESLLEEQINADDIISNISDVVIKYYLDAKFVNSIGVGLIKPIVVENISLIYDEAISLPGANAASDMIFKNLKKIFEPIITTYFRQQQLDVDFNKIKIDYSKEPNEIVTQFFLRAADNNIRLQNSAPGSISLQNNGVDTVISNVPSSGFNIIDGDTIEHSGETFRLQGIDAYESFIVSDTKTGQDFYDRSSNSYASNIARVYSSEWGNLNNVNIIRYGSDNRGVRTVGEIELTTSVPSLNGSAGDIANALMVKKGYFWPMALQSNVYSTNRDKVYIENAKTAMLSNLGCWNSNTGLPDFYNNGFKLENGVAIPVTQGALKTVLPGAFREIAKRHGWIISVPINSVFGFSGFTSGQVENFTMTVKINKVEKPMVIRALKNSSITYNQFINNVYYFMTLGRNVRTIEAFSDITQGKTDSTNMDAYFLNAFIGPAELYDVGNLAVTHLHLFLPLSEITDNDTSDLSNRLLYKNTSSDFVPFPRHTAHVDSRLISQKAVTYNFIKEMLNTADTFIKYNTPTLNDPYRSKERIGYIIEDLFIKKKSLDASISNEPISIDKEGNIVTPIKYQDDWVPLAFSSFRISTIPGQPKSLYANFTFLPFDYSSFTNIFGYIATENNAAIKSIASSPKENRYELDLSKTAVVTDWLDRTYLNTNGGLPVGYFNPDNENTSDLEIAYSYPLPAFADFNSEVRGRTVKVYEQSLIKFFKDNKPADYVPVDKVEKIYNTIITSVSLMESNNIRRIPLQAGVLPTIQHIGGGEIGIEIEILTNNLDSISSLRKIDMLMSKITRSNFNDKLPVKLRLLHPLISLIGDKEYIVTDMVISDATNKQGFYSIVMSFRETSISRPDESLDLVTNHKPIAYDSKLQIADYLANLLAACGDDNVDKATSDQLWSLLIGPTGYIPVQNTSKKIVPFPMALFYADNDQDGEYTITVKNGRGNKTSGRILRLNGKSSSIIADIGKSESVDILTNILRDEIVIQYSSYKSNHPLYKSSDIINVLNGLSDDKILRLITDKLYRDFTLLNYAPILNSHMITLQSVTGLILSNQKKPRDYSYDSLGNVWSSDIITENLAHSDIQKIYLYDKGAQQNLYGAFAINPLRLINLITNSSTTGVGIFYTSQFTSEHLNNPITGVTYRGNGFWGSYMNGEKTELAIENRFKIYNTPMLSITSENVKVYGNKNSGAGNIPASVVSSISDGLYKYKKLYYDRKNEYTCLPIRDVLLKFFNNALSSEVYLSYIESLIYEFGEKLFKLSSIVPELSNIQTGYKKLNLPTYKELYGVLSTTDDDISNIVKLCKDISFYGMSMDEYDISDLIVEFERYSGRGNLQILRSKLKSISKPNIKSDIDNMVSVLKSILNKTDLIPKDRLNKKNIESIFLKLNAACLSLIILLESKAVSIGDSKNAIDVPVEVYPTFRNLGCPARVNDFGIVDMDTPARSLDDLVEAGWQYYSPQSIDLNIYMNDVGQNTAFTKNDKPFQSSKGREKTPHRFDDTESPIGLNDPNNNIKLPESYNPSIYDSDKLNKRILNEYIDKNIDKDVNSSTISYRPFNEKKDKKGNNVPGDLTKENTLGRDNVHPIKPGYMSSHSEAIDRFTSNRVFDTRKMFPNVSLFFIRDINNQNNIFEDWNDYYKYDSIQYCAVTNSKNGVSTAVIRLTNITGLLSNEFDYDKSNYTKNDVENNGNVTAAKATVPTIRYDNNGNPTSLNTTDTNTPNRILSFMLTPGTKIQIRMGYSTVNRENEIVFSGRVAEMTPGSYIELVAQGHEYEAMRTINNTYGGSYNTFPYIITDMLRNTSNFGHIQQYPWQRYANGDKHLLFTEKVFGINNTVNDNLWGLQNDGSLEKFWHFKGLFNGHNWHCNGPILENIHSMRRYLPNYAVNVRPFDTRATLFFGPKDSLYIYTAENKRDKMKYNSLKSVLKEKNKNSGKLLDAPNNEYINVIKTYDIIFSNNASHSIKKPIELRDIFAEMVRRTRQSSFNYIFARNKYFGLQINDDPNVNFFDSGISITTVNQSISEYSDEINHLFVGVYSYYNNSNKNANLSISYSTRKELMQYPIYSHSDLINKYMIGAESLIDFKYQLSLNASNYNDILNSLNGVENISPSEKKDILEKIVYINESAYAEAASVDISKLQKDDAAKPLIWFARIATDNNGQRFCSWVGYISASIFAEKEAKSIAFAAAQRAKISSDYEYISYPSYASNARKPTDVAPDMKPFKMHHFIPNHIIVRNDINASTSNMANRVTLYYPDDYNATESAEKIKDSDLNSYPCSYAPFMEEEYDVAVFDANADFADYGAQKAVQVAHEYLGDYMRDMYQGSITILGNPSIFPYHTINVQDNFKDMHGTMEVDTVTHIYDATGGFTTTIIPKLLVYVNEDTEAAAVYRQSMKSALWSVAEYGLLAAAVVATAFTGAGGIILASALISGSWAFRSSYNRDREQSNFSILGFPLLWPSSVGYQSHWSADGNSISPRRNPIRIDPIVYKGVPMVAGISNFNRYWRNREVTQLFENAQKEGRNAYLNDISHSYATMVSDTSKAWEQFKLNATYLYKQEE